jgi:hypothetical protein
VHHSLTGPFWGNVAIVALAGGITLACLAAMLRMLIRPGERDTRHPKHLILDDNHCTGDRSTGG